MKSQKEKWHILQMAIYSIYKKKPGNNAIGIYYYQKEIPFSDNCFYTWINMLLQSTIQEYITIFGAKQNTKKLLLSAIREMLQIN